MFQELRKQRVRVGTLDLRIAAIAIAGGFALLSSKLHLTFSDGKAKTVDVRPLLTGPVFRPLLVQEFFERVQVDPICRTVAWPNGADIAPEALHALQPCSASAAQ